MIEERQKKLKGLIPSIKVFYSSDGKKALPVFEYIEGEMASDEDKDEVEELVRKLKKLDPNFNPDNNLSNFIKTNDGRLVYVDCDIAEPLEPEKENHPSF